MKAAALALVVASLSQLAIAIPTHASPNRTACAHACLSCGMRCGNDRQCKTVCYELKRSCCAASGNGPGPRNTCSCT